MTTLEEFDKLKKHIKTKEGKKEAKAFRIKLKRSEIYANKLETYFTDTLDGMEPDRSKNELGL
ncbi:hypothetical protein [Maribacter sp.]|uniref:hypothetical protein n=1 Tax=Maribacter sp. TaxID=1897614 RepID=UPI0025BD7D86|nr:hypothetical protein [Maribacter sp.]